MSDTDTLSHMDKIGEGTDKPGPWPPTPTMATHSSLPCLQQIPKTGPLAELAKLVFHDKVEDPVEKHPCDDGCDYAIAVGMPEHHCSVRCMHDEAPDEPRDR